ncbi:hypothetical protein EJB05_48616 [Eragrostis curvula]|uniref:SAM-dependent MTase RsmB/NOP-type domain-containing protein n=1 Tax=Eragrostis curvula TaxID=38414 RepID=A0A5J9T2E1_9POAL|nr:hypothetical protein EJB05_48616 [Eragrostis curvula]
MFPLSTQESHTVCGKVVINIENYGSSLKNHIIGETNNINCDMAKSLGSSSNITDSNFPLHRCMRIVPHDQNSGAFFIAVFHKVAPFNDSQIVDMAKLQHTPVADSIMQLQKELEPEIRPSENSVVDQQLIEVADHVELLESDQAESGDTMQKSQNQSRWKGVDPVLFLEDEVVIESLVSFFGIQESFPFRGHLVTRSIQANNARRIYYISKSVQEILQLNLEVGEQLKIASLGLRMFETHRSKDGCSCAYRLCYEGLPLLLPYVSKRVLYASAVDFHRLLQYRTIKFAHFVDAKLGEEAAVLTPGCCVVVLRDEGHSLSVDPSTTAMVCWRGKGTMNVMVSPLHRKDLLERMEYLFGLNAAKVEKLEVM